MSRAQERQFSMISVVQIRNKVYEDQRTSAAKGRNKRPAFDALLKAAVRRDIDLIAVCSSDRHGRSLSHLVEVLQTIRDTGTGLYIHTQSVDNTTPAGTAMFGILSIFSEFEREIVARVKAGIAGAKDAIDRGQPTKLARRELAKGTGILETAKLTGALPHVRATPDLIAPPKNWRSYCGHLRDLDLVTQGRH